LRYLAVVKCLWFFAILLTTTLNAQNALIVSAKCGEDRQVHLTLKNGRETSLPWLPEQSGCDDLRISPDHRSAGWLILESGSAASGTSPLATGVNVFRANGPVRRYTDDMLVWDWRFADSHRLVLSTNTSHGPQTNDPHFVVYDLRSGKLLRKWNGVAGEKVPSWAAGLRY
jgi:hypothetical protein